MPQNVGCKEDPISKNIPSRHQRDTWALGLQRHVTWCGVIRWVLGFNVRAKNRESGNFKSRSSFSVCYAVLTSHKNGETAVIIIIIIIIIIELKQQQRGQQWMVKEIQFGFFQTLPSLFSDTKFAKWSIIFIFLEYSSQKIRLRLF